MEMANGRRSLSLVRMVMGYLQIGGLAAQLTGGGGVRLLLRSGAYDLGAGVTSAETATGRTAGWFATGASWGLSPGFSVVDAASPLENFLKDI